MDLKRTMISALAALGIATGTFAVAATPAHAESKGNALYRGQALFRGDWIMRETNDGTVHLTMQRDGNLVLWLHPHANYGDKICWASGSTTGYKAQYQGDGNFVLYDGGDNKLWASNTKGWSGSTVDISSSGQLYVGEKQLFRCQL